MSRSDFPPPPPPPFGPRGPRGHRPPPPPFGGPEAFFDRFVQAPWFDEGRAWGPGPHLAMRRMRRGDIRTSLLMALTDGPAHGYELMNRLSARSGGRWRPSPGSVYPTLQALEDEGLVRSAQADGKRVYEITDEGRAQASARIEAGGAPWAAGEDPPPPDPLRSAGEQLLGAVRQVELTRNPALAEQALQVLTEARRALFQLLAQA